MRLSLTALCLATLSLATGLQAQTVTVGPCSPKAQQNARGWGNGRRAIACETRSTVLSGLAHLDVNNVNGAIEVLGEDRSDVALEANVFAQAATLGEAKATLHEITLTTAPAIEAHGPRLNGNSNPGWHVDYRLHVPHGLVATIRTFNGPVTLAGLTDTVDARTNNGPLILRDLAGDITARTVNGPVTLSLSGRQWTGKGLSAQTTNGGISLNVPSGYSAHLVAQTTHGGIVINLPIANRGSSRTHLDTTLGHGGPTLQLTTTNGGIVLNTN